ncbi:hypothetical protein [Fulvivirga sediminis]|nr:hypothetical protein [Fulvivirga sediminis]
MIENRILFGFDVLLKGRGVSFSDYRADQSWNDENINFRIWNR